MIAQEFLCKIVKFFKPEKLVTVIIYERHSNGDVKNKITIPVSNVFTQDKFVGIYCEYDQMKESKL